jgi:hypothetical protein
MPDLITYGGGRLLTDPSPIALWATVRWPDGNEEPWALVPARCVLDQLFMDIFATSWYTTLSELYSVPGKTIRPGTFLGTSGIGLTSTTPSPIIDDSDIEASLTAAINESLVPAPLGDVVYVILVPQLVTVTRQGRRSGVEPGNFGGYHDTYPLPGGRNVSYCVIASTVDPNQITERVSHEFAEVITDPIAGEGWTGPDPTHQKPGRLEICDFCEDGPKAAVQIKGYTLATFATEADACVPDPEPGARAVVDTATISFDRSATRSSCVGAIIEDQSVFFHVATLHRGKPSIIEYIDWTASEAQNRLVFPEGPDGHHKRVFAVIVPFGVTSFTVTVQVTTELGCDVTATQVFTVVTQDVANEQDFVCGEIHRLQQLAHLFVLPPPFPPPIWDPARDVAVNPLTHGELVGLRRFGQALMAFATRTETVVTE